MEGTTSTSNEGSKRDLSKYKKLDTKNVSNKKIDDLFDGTEYSFSLNCLACDVKTNVKTADSENPVSASSADTKVFDLEEIEANAPWLNVRLVTPEKEGIISKKRKAAKAKKQAEKEAKEAKEAEEAKEAAKAKELEEAKKEKLNEK